MRGLVSFLLALVALCPLCPVTASPEIGLAELMGTNGTSANTPHALFSRQRNEVIRCDKDTPCSNGDCCNGQSGFCGRRPEFCDASVCTSNCEAKPECGIRADKFDCPLNVCCSYWGNCGSTEDFCNERCQSNCARPPSTGHSQGDVRDLVIGYYESWTLAEDGCRVMKLSDIPVSSLTHINVAFGYIKPNSYIVHPMEPATDEIFRDLTGLKRKAPGLKIWLSLGGWTFSDNGTDTQPVFGDLSSTPQKRAKFIGELIKFMRYWGFDGVDIDWEYPGAPDRGGNEWVDTANYVSLLADMRAQFDAEPEGWGISFAAPTSYWYLRWFDIEGMIPYVNWINLMSYDLHGSWDTEDSYVGNYLNSHTNLTEIKDALDLLWRNNVPASMVNLGIGFYGRSFQLDDTSCSLPGCKQKGPADAGPCTGQAGVLSYGEIMTLIKVFNLNVIHDEVAGVKYIAWNDDQWIAFDDPETLQQKVEFANENGLGGVMIWAIDLDDKENSALDALLQPEGLGKFARQNGVSAELGGWTRQGAQCELGPCSESPSCPRANYFKHGHDLDCPKEGERRNICCDRTAFPDEKTCAWHDGEADVFDWLGLGPGFVCNSASCPSGTVLMVENDRFWVDNPGDAQDGDARCVFGGKAKYCCETTGEQTFDVCKPLEGNCDYHISRPVWSGDIKFPSDEEANAMCGSGKYFMGYVGGECEIWNDEFQPVCCPSETPKDACYFPEDNEDNRCKDIQSCGTGETAVEGGPFTIPNGYNCYGYAGEGLLFNSKPICCDIDKLEIETKTVPVPLEWLFPDADDIPESHEEKFNLQVETGDGDAGAADENAFGFVVMSGPKEDLISIDKRDGSHWELLGCERHDGRQTVRAVCTDTSEGSNCGDIFLGRVAETVVEMPPHCGAGRYAVAVSMEPSANQTLTPDVVVKLGRRRTVAPRLYDFTFDYDFKPIQARDSSDVLLRIDYASEPGYWASVVNSRPDKRKRSLEEMHHEVRTRHGGSWPSFLHETFRIEKRETPEHELDQFHKRWFSKDVGDWLDKIRQVDVSFDAVEHRIHENYRWNIFDESISCTNYRATMKSWIDLDLDVQITTTVTLIGDLANPKTWDQSGLLFRVKGGVVTQLNLEVNAELFFTTGPIELFGAQNFGLVFTVPGLVTIGPNMRIIGQISGLASLHLDASVKLDVVKWDYTQRYPIEGGGNTVKDATIVDEEGDEPEAGAAGTGTSLKPEFFADVKARGSLTVSVTPRVEFGIVFHHEAIPDSVVAMALLNEMTLYGDAGVGTNQAAFVCYGIEGRSNLYASVQAPDIFGINLSNRWNIFDIPFDLLPRTCPL